jgi:hypothetical protein
VMLASVLYMCGFSLSLIIHLQQQPLKINCSNFYGLTHRMQKLSSKAARVDLRLFTGKQFPVFWTADSFLATRTLIHCTSSARQDWIGFMTEQDRIEQDRTGRQKEGRRGRGVDRES